MVYLINLYLQHRRQRINNNLHDQLPAARATYVKHLSRTCLNDPGMQNH